MARRASSQRSHRIYLQAVLIKPETDIIKQAAAHMTLDVAQVVYVTIPAYGADGCFASVWFCLLCEGV